MVTADRVAEIFADVRHVYQSALLRLEAGDIRDAAEKAWCATKRATDALILAQTGREPSIPSQTSGGLRSLAHADDRFRPLRNHYNACVTDLHTDCFYNGHCDPEELIIEIIQETGRYIEDAERLAATP